MSKKLRRRLDGGTGEHLFRRRPRRRGHPGGPVERSASLARLRRRGRAALQKAGHHVDALELDPALAQALGRSRARGGISGRARRPRRRGCLQGLLEVLGLPYVGSGVLASALALRQDHGEDGLPAPRVARRRRSHRRRGDDLVPRPRRVRGRYRPRGGRETARARLGHRGHPHPWRDERRRAGDGARAALCSSTTPPFASGS